jgi:hypothetical protein
MQVNSSKLFERPFWMLGASSEPVLEAASGFTNSINLPAPRQQCLTWVRRRVDEMGCILALNLRIKPQAFLFDETGAIAVNIAKLIPALVVPLLFAALHDLSAQTPAMRAPAAPATGAPAWAQPGSATHAQVAPPPEFHQPSKNCDAPSACFRVGLTLAAPLCLAAPVSTRLLAIHHRLRGLQHLVYARRVPLSLKENVRRCFPHGRHRFP